jgi:phosphatidylglycerol:prolipoprotein diacylglycerol transferase
MVVRMLSVLAYYVHNLNPIIFSLGPITPRWYGFSYLMGFLGAYLLIMKLQRDGMLRLPRERVPDLVLNCCIFGVLIGGRLGYCLFYDHRLLGFSSEFPYWGVLKVWDGGMSAHGGILFTVLTIIWFGWKQSKQKDAPGFDLAPAGAPVGAVQKESAFTKIVNIGDAACMVVPIGLCFGRIANFINGELYGHFSNVPWAVKFPSEIYAPTNNVMDPTLEGKLPGVFTHLFGPGNWTSASGFQEGLSILSQKLRMHDPAAVHAVAQVLQPRHPSQLYESLLEGVLLFIICWTVGRLWRKDGMASGAFLTFYPIMRIIGEQFRVGDTPRQYFGVTMSLGVLYSLPLVLIGLIWWGYWIWRDRRVPWKRMEGETAPASEVSPSKT